MSGRWESNPRPEHGFRAYRLLVLWSRVANRFDRLDSNKNLKKSKCFIQCRLGTRKPFFLSLNCTEFVPSSQSIQC